MQRREAVLATWGWAGHKPVEPTGPLAMVVSGGEKDQGGKVPLPAVRLSTLVSPNGCTSIFLRARQKKILCWALLQMGELKMDQEGCMFEEK